MKAHTARVSAEPDIWRGARISASVGLRAAMVEEGRDLRDACEVSHSISPTLEPSRTSVSSSGKWRC